MRWKKAAVLLFSALLVLFSFLDIQASELDDLKITGYVNDYTGTLTTSQINELDALGRSLDADTGAQVVFVIVDSLNGQDIREAGLNIGVNNQIGSKRNDSGLVFLMALHDREYAMEVGDGLEGILPDIKTKHIMDQYLLPYLKQGQYAQGIVALYKEVVDVIRANADEVGTPADSLVQSSKGDEQSWMSSLIFLIVFGIILYLIFKLISQPSAPAQPQSIHLHVGEDFYLNAKGYDFKTDAIAVSSRNPDIVSVQADGWIHANRTGSTIITMQKSGASAIQIPVTVGSSGYSNRRNNELLEGFLLGALIGTAVRPRRRYYSPGPGFRPRPPQPPRGGFGGPGRGFGGSSGGFGSGGGFRGGGGGFSGGGSRGRW